MKKLILLVLAILSISTTAYAYDFSIGGLKFSFGKSPTTLSDVQIMGRSDGRSFVGGGVCTGYAYRMNAADVFNVDSLAICFVATGTFEDNEDSKFVGGVGLSPVSFFDGKLKTFIGYDLGNRKSMQGSMTTLSAVMKF